MSKKFSQFNQATEPNFDEEVVGLQSGDNMRTKFPWRGPFDASVNQYPSTGGSGPSGAIFSGDSWYASVGGTISGITVNAGDLIICLVSTPGQTASNWKISKSAADAWPLSGSAALTDDVIISGAFDLSFIVDRLIVTMDDGVDFGELNIDPDAFNFLSSGYVTMISDDGTNYNEITVNPNGINLDVSDGVDSSSLTMGPDSLDIVVDGLLSVTIDGGTIDTGVSPFYIGPSTQQRFYVDATTVALQSEGSSGNVFIGGADNASQLFHVAQSGSGQDIFRIGTISSSQNEIYLTTEGVSGTVRIQPITSDQTEILSVRENGGSSIFTCGETSGNAHANFSVPVGLPTYTVATLPAAASYPRCLVWVSDEVDGACVAVSNATNWLRIYDGAIVSA